MLQHDIKISLFIIMLISSMYSRFIGQISQRALPTGQPDSGICAETRRQDDHHRHQQEGLRPDPEEGDPDKNWAGTRPTVSDIWWGTPSGREYPGVLWHWKRSEHRVIR